MMLTSLKQFSAKTVLDYEKFESVYRAKAEADPDRYPLLFDSEAGALLECFIHFCANNGEILPLPQRPTSASIGFRQLREEPSSTILESEARFNRMMRLSSDWYWEQDAEHRFTFIDGQATCNEEESPHQYLGKRRWETGLEIVGGWDAHRALLNARVPFYDAVMFRASLTPNPLPASGPGYSAHPANVTLGGRRYIRVSGEPMIDRYGVFQGYRGFGRDITEQKIADERIQFLATHDGLTSLVNRARFVDLVNSAVQASRRYERRFAVIFLDIDGFKDVNDRFGHDPGDKVLQEIAHRLSNCVRTDDVVARLSGDEFGLLLREIGDIAKVNAVAQKILGAIAAPIQIGHHDCTVTASLGISLFPVDAQDGPMLISLADNAMYSTKANGKNHFQFYSIRN